MKKTRNVLSILLSLLVLLGITLELSTSIFADELPESWYENNDYLYFLDDDGTVSIVKYNGNAADLIIPDEIDGKPVTNFSYNAFLGCKSLTSVTIPDGVTEINYSTFGECINLKKVVIPDSVVSISQWAFEGCTSLTYVRIPANVEFLGSEAFLGCSSLKGAVILNKNCEIYDSFIDSSTGEDRFNLTDFTIYGYENSTSQVYAEKTGYDFVAIDEPIIAEGTDTVYKQGSENGTSIHCVYPLDTFISVSVDGNIADEASYTLEDGSTILTFKPSFLDSLSAGTHIVTMEYTIGSITTELTVEGTDADSSETEKSQEQTTQEAEKTTTVKNKSTKSPESTASTAIEKNTSTKSPDTGYNSSYAAVISAAVISVGMVFIARKKKN